MTPPPVKPAVKAASQLSTNGPPTPVTIPPHQSASQGIGARTKLIARLKTRGRDCRNLEASGEVAKADDQLDGAGKGTTGGPGQPDPEAGQSQFQDKYQEE